MARRGGPLADMQRAAHAAAREAERRQREAQRQYVAQVRAAERAAAAEQRAIAAHARASEAERKRLEKEMKAAHVEAREAEVASRNAAINAVYDDITNLLSATLAVDDHVDLEQLRRRAEHPAFPHADLLTPLPAPAYLPDPSPPRRADPEPPKGVFGKKKKAQAAESAADASYAKDYAAWQAAVSALPGRRAAAAQAHAQVEGRRLAALERAQARYEQECADREDEVARHNAELDALIAGLGYGTVEAVQQYVAIVMSNSVYPEHFPVDHSFEFDPTTAELSVQTRVIGPHQFPTIKAWKYNKSSDEIVATEQPQKASRDRYADAIAQVALRTMHEVFEADRRGLIKSVTLKVGTETNHPATGAMTYIPLVAVAAERDTFLSFDLSAVVPSATLAHLGAAVSKNPWALVAADTTGVRRT